MSFNVIFVKKGVTLWSNNLVYAIFFLKFNVWSECHVLLEIICFILILIERFFW